jgi:DNA (cytosine-5)-methyltransferase 1
MLNGLDLFSGIGGISYALRDYVKPLAYCENERYCQGVLLSRMQSGDIRTAPIWDDVRTLKQELLPPIDIIYGGFPCQDISIAGRGKGLDGSRSGLVFEFVRLILECRPKFVFMENVPAITYRGLDRVLLELAALGFDARWTIVSAREMEAPHLRERWFLLAYSNSKSGRIQSDKLTECQNPPQFRDDGSQKSMADPQNTRCEQLLERFGRKEEKSFFGLSSGWKIESNICRVADGIPKRVDRIKSLGNAVVPIQAKEAFERLMGIK